MHLSNLFLFNAVVLNALLCAIFAILTRQFWRDLKPKQNRITRAIAVFFGSLALATGWSAVYTTAVLLGIDSYTAEAVILFVRDISLTILLASTVYLIVELKYGNH